MSRYNTDEYRAKHAAYEREWRKTHKNKKSHVEAQRRYKERHPEKYRDIQARNSVKKNYGITLEQKNALFRSQGECCAICKSTAPGRKGAAWAVDHCHDSGKVRGILCHPCNAMLGYSKDNPDTLAAAIEYLAANPKPKKVPVPTAPDAEFMAAQIDIFEVIARADAPPAAKDQLGLFEGIAA